MSKLVLDPPAVESPVERATQSPVDPSPKGDMGTRVVLDRTSANATERDVKTWPLGAHLTIGAVALFLLAMLAIVAIFSVPSAALVTFDGVVAIGILVLSLALSMLMVIA